MISLHPNAEKHRFDTFLGGFRYGTSQLDKQNTKFVPRGLRFVTIQQREVSDRSGGQGLKTYKGSQG